MTHTETPAAAARRHGVHPETIRRWIRAGHISCQTTITGGRYMVDPEEVDRAFAVHRPAAASPEVTR